MARIVGLCCFFRKAALRICFTLYHRGVVGTNQQLPLSIRQARSLEACLFCVPKCCLELSTATDPFPERESRVTSCGLCVIFLIYLLLSLEFNFESTRCPPDVAVVHFSLAFSPSPPHAYRTSRAVRGVMSLASTGET